MSFHGRVPSGELAFEKAVSIFLAAMKTRRKPWVAEMWASTHVRPRVERQDAVETISVRRLHAGAARCALGRIRLLLVHERVAAAPRHRIRKPRPRAGRAGCIATAPVALAMSWP